MMTLAMRNLFQSKVHLLISVGGVSLALMIILAFDAIFTGVEGQLAAYIDHSRADVFVSQAGVRNLHMVASWLPASVVGRVRAVQGVQEATPILYLTGMVVARGNRNIAYVIGLPPRATVGTPWRIVGGAPIPGRGQVVIDRGVAAHSGVGLGATVTILGLPYRVSGLSEGTASLVNSVAFISFGDFARARGNAPVVSFVLVRVRPGTSVATVVARIGAQVPGVTVQSRQTFGAQERQLVQDMDADVITIMNLVGLLTGLAVLALTVYTATLARRAEYGVLKALGTRNGQLYRVVMAQACGSAVLGFVLALAGTLLLSQAVSWSGSTLALQVSGASLVKVGALTLLIATGAAILPIVQVTRLDPATVFRGGMQ